MTSSKAFVEVQPLMCPYCKQRAEQVTGARLYPHRPDLAEHHFFLCAPCDAYVGTHQRSGAPLGTLANRSLRRLRNTAHAVFDPLWRKHVNTDWLVSRKGKGPKPTLGDLVKRHRTAAYAALAAALDISVENCHIALFDEEQCRRVIDICKSREDYRSL